MNTTEGFEGSPIASVQIFVPSLDVADFSKSMTPDGKGWNKRVGGEELGVSVVEAEAYILRGL